ncbi:FYVE zinc finger-domain-containing protein [Chaetomidium leptoderma]|uniref:RING-type E3 ubiquitin transferase n=1 Tax=Chaetomidium leptoderma TaxID=669021 RepID=A0AAN6VF71_9PEZI|nr:FYVE zinc finger-domain-containing protein [Chaetomidium leptoderma]
MATPDAGGPSRLPHVPTDADNDSQSTLSDSVSHDYDYHQHQGVTCRWRTTRYHDQECSRFFDCPSHAVERAHSDTEQGLDGEDEEEQQGYEDAESETAQRRPDPGAVSPLSEDGGENDGHQRARSPSPDVPVVTGDETDMPLGERTESESVVSQQQQQQQQQHDTGASLSSRDVLAGSLPFQAQTQPESGRSETSDGDGGVPTSPAPSLMRRGSGVVSGPQAISRSAASPAPATRMVSRPSPLLSTPTGRARPEVALPRWQPDSEVTYCPICGTQFSIFVRKHHCRKCGRVVCNACSPHRITIPHQYIVRPPGAPRPLAQGPSLSLLDSQGWYPEFGGGERVRLCNPCVPDPNTAPPQSRGGQASSQNDLTSPVQADDAALSNRWNYYFGAGAANDAQTRSRSATMQPGSSSSSRPPHPPLRSNEARILWGTPPAYYRPPPVSQTPHLFPGVTPRYRSMLDVGNRPGPSSSAGAAGPSTASSSASRRFHSVVPPRPQIAEEDECPVCHRELPPRTLPNFESLREAHITTCITSHSRYGGGPATTTTTTTTTPGGGDGDDPNLLLLPSVSPPRRTGMFPYTATEKDCVDSAECSICLEEFEAGVAMARLECLCRFHRACINAWWERHPGRCPMHQHDGFGY